jgi:signal transduction histidine kinase
MAAQAEEAHSALHLHLSPDDVELVAERDTLRRALINIIRNALQACTSGGEVTITVAAPSPSSRTIEVRDSGCGIPPEQLAQVLTPFYTTKEKGSGLGLALTHKILNQHGGRLELESAVGVGTTVRMILPFDPDAPEIAAAAIPEGWLG